MKIKNYNTTSLLKEESPSSEVERFHFYQASEEKCLMLCVYWAGGSRLLLPYITLNNVTMFSSSGIGAEEANLTLTFSSIIINATYQTLTSQSQLSPIAQNEEINLGPSLLRKRVAAHSQKAQTLDSFMEGLQDQKIRVLYHNPKVSFTLKVFTLDADGNQIEIER